MPTVVKDYGRHNMPPSPPFLRETIVFETTMIIVGTKTPSLIFFFFFFVCVCVSTHLEVGLLHYRIHRPREV